MCNNVLGQVTVQLWPFMLSHLYMPPFFVLEGTAYYVSPSQLYRSDTLKNIRSPFCDFFGFFRYRISCVQLFRA